MTNLSDTLAALSEAAKWLRECSDWMLSNDLDMTCPMQTDPLDIAEALESISTGQLVPVPSVEVAGTVKENFTDEALDKPVNLEVVQWEGRLHCAYMNDFRIAGGKPWGGGSTAKKWTTSLREIIRAFPELQKALGLDYLGRPTTTASNMRRHVNCCGRSEVKHDYRR